MVDVCGFGGNQRNIWCFIGDWGVGAWWIIEVGALGGGVCAFRFGFMTQLVLYRGARRCLTVVVVVESIRTHSLGSVHDFHLMISWLL